MSDDADPPLRALVEKCGEFVQNVETTAWWEAQKAPLLAEIESTLIGSLPQQEEQMADIHAEDVPVLTLKIAAFLTMIADGHTPPFLPKVQQEARELVNELGESLARPQAPEEPQPWSQAMSARSHHKDIWLRELRIILWRHSAAEDGGPR